MSRYINAIFQDITGLDIDARGAVMQWETDTHNKYTAAIIPSTLSTGSVYGGVIIGESRRVFQENIHVSLTITDLQTKKSGIMRVRLSKDDVDGIAVSFASENGIDIQIRGSYMKEIFLTAAENAIPKEST